MIKKLLNSVISQRATDRRAELYKNLIRHEAKIGGELFGPVPEGVRREFFCLDEHTVIWHEEWLDNNKKRQIRTTRYDINPQGILKAQDGRGYQRVTVEEAGRLYEAVKLYGQRINKELYAFAQ